MEPDKEEILRQRQLTFIGKVLADFPHSLRNPLDTIRESRDGLAELLGQAGQGIEEDREKYAEILSRIEDQIEILARKSKYLIRIAKRIGKTSSFFDPSDIVQEVVSLLARPAHLRQVSIRHEETEALPRLHGDPDRIFFLVSILINDVLEKLGRGGKITVRAKSVEKTVLIEVEGSGAIETAASSPVLGDRYGSIGQQVVADLGARLEKETTGDDMSRTSLFLPIQEEGNDQ
ncbi:MAG: hypothetical protein JRF02_09410 [Deltaproteobacteria bacterium]|jgi:signal transduction histidine kinase|nr:hypothetical protein [Deltaproteobacteria bacterium]